MGHASRTREALLQDARKGLSTTQVYDRFAHPIQEGDVVHLLGKVDIMWRVQAVKPALGLAAPAGTVELQLVAIIHTGVPGGRPIADMLKVQDAEALRTPVSEGLES